MSRTRNQRRRDGLFEKIFIVVMLILLVFCLAAIAKQCRDINALQQENNKYRGQIVLAENYLPEGFDAQSAAYQSALQRYEIEQGHIIPEKNEAAPEPANSEADRCKGAS